MNAILRGVLGAALLILPATAQAGHAHGARAYRETGYYQWDAYKCKWIWYPYAKQTYGSYDNHSTTLHLTVNHFQSSAKRGETGYATLDLGYKARNPLDPNTTLNFAKDLLGVAYRGANDGFQQAMAYASQEGANDIEVVKELVQVKKLEASALILESSKPSPSGHFHQNQKHVPAVETQPTPAANNLGGAEAKCLKCHEDGQNGNGVVLPKFGEFTAEQGGIALDYITSIRGNNCAKRAELTDEEQKQLVRFFAKKSNQ